MHKRLRTDGKWDFSQIEFSVFDLTSRKVGYTILCIQIYHGTRHSYTYVNKNQSWFQDCKGHSEIFRIMFEI